jgi:hypothetical protein
MEFAIHKDNPGRIINLMFAIGHEFPALMPDLLSVAKQASNGITVEVRPYVASQTNKQRGYYWKWCKEFGRFTGNTPNEIHEELLCICYGSEDVYTRIGLRRRPLQRSSKANRTEYSELIETLIQTAAEMGFIVPPPLTEME